MKIPIRSILRNILVLPLLLAAAACGWIDTGNVGVRNSFGTVSMQPETGFYTSWTSSVQEYTAKEFSIPLRDLHPKAKDNLLLREFDALVYYHVAPKAIPALTTQYTAQSRCEHGLCFPAWYLVEAMANQVIQDQIKLYPSLDVQNEREKIAADAAKVLQEKLNGANPGVFTVTRFVIQKVLTDASIEANIQRVVNNQKLLEAKALEQEIARKDADIEVTRAQGIQRSNSIINGTLTREYLQHEANLALMEFAKKGGTSTVMFPVGLGAPAPLFNLNK